MIKKVGIIKANSQYNVIRTWVLELEKAFEELGIETVIYDLKYHKTFKFYDDLDFFIGFSGWGAEEFTKFETPFVMVMADQVLDHIEDIKHLRKKDVLFVMDEHDLEILKLLKLNVNAHFLPHASIEEFKSSTTKKDIDCLFLGSYSNPDAFLQDLKSVQPELVRTFMFQLLDYLKDHPDVHYAKFILQQFKNSGFEINAYEREDFIILINLIGRFFYSTKRLELLNNLIEADISVQIFGNGWENSDFSPKKNVTIHPAVNFYQAQQLMKRTKIVLNMQPFLVSGTHERIYSAIANNSVVLTNKTDYIQQVFKENRGVIFYDHINPIPAIEQIYNVLNLNEADYNGYVHTAFENIKDSYSYKHRALEMITALNNILPHNVKVYEE